MLVATDALNSEAIPFFDPHGIPLLRVLTDRGSEHCGNREHHEYALYLDVENIEHSRTKAKSPQTNGICERFNKACKNEFYSAAFQRKVYRSIDEIQLDLDLLLRQYNNERVHSGKCCCGKTPMQTFVDLIPLSREKLFGHNESDGHGNQFSVLKASITMSSTSLMQSSSHWHVANLYIWLHLVDLF